jgi:broad specificity phosphatase PhoE
LTQRVILVRHALSALDPNVDSRQWGLAEGARADCVRLADALDVRPTFVLTSDERKAIDTASVVADVKGAEVRIDARFGEVERPYTHGDYRAIAERYLRDGVAKDWEARPAVISRFASAVDDSAATDEPLVVVNHGLAMSLYINSISSDIDVMSFWTSLTFPDAWSLDRSTGAVERVFDGGRPASS